MSTELERAISRPLTSVNLRRLFVLLTQQHFSDPLNYGDLRDELKDLAWNVDAKLRTLFIGLQHDYNPREALSVLPALYYGLGDFDFQPEVMGDRAGNNEDNSAAHYVTVAKVPMQWVHCAASADFASNLAETTFSFFMAIRAWLIKNFQLHDFRVNQISMPHLETVQGGQSYYRVDLRGLITYNHIITVHEHSLRLKKVAVETDLAQAQLDPRALR